MISKNRFGLVFGLFFAIMHAIWAIAVAITPSGMEKFLDWVMSLHFMTMAITINPFSLGKAILLVIVTFIVGFVLGWIFAAVLNWVKAK